MSGFFVRICPLRPLLLSFQNSSRTLCSVQPAPPSTPTNIDEAYLSSSKIDIENIFLSKRVQQLLSDLTCKDVNQIFASRMKEYSPPQYKLLTDKQFEEEMEKAMRKVDELTQMPPVLRKRKPCQRILRRDPELQGLHTTNFVFTDVSFGYHEHDRPIVVREPDGTLRTASWEERERMLQTYLATPGREIELPKMFTEPHLTSVLDDGKYVFVLDRACLQFEPNSEQYLGVTQRVYAHLMETGKFDELRSTRHFGPMCFYYAVTHQCDPLILSLLKSGSLERAAKVVELLHVIHPKLESARKINSGNIPELYVEAYIKWDSQNKAALELALQSIREANQDDKIEHEKE
ncbi:28S ribosomal protein S22, mitochondrial-like [Varroa jacobsoni]|uniref:28S ribosomal protein S22, mitochondrial-like n=1 Tax=Varroa jacobsoni TaxID=62625 RepID=UPI000BF31BA5|nr:28S ribosomal protein S22, mitochondrial-like [Varroa jacobsoni]